MSTQQTHQYKYLGGHIALDFANTVSWRLGDNPIELLESFDDLIRWSIGAGLIDEQKAAALRLEAKRSPQAAETALRKAVKMREVCYRLIESVLHNSAPESADVETINGFIRQAKNGTELLWNGKTFVRERWISPTELDSMIEPIVHATAELLTSKNVTRIAQCLDDRGCGWVFLDNSRSKRRRWCSMADCGNRAKAKRHYQRSKA